MSARAASQLAQPGGATSVGNAQPAINDDTGQTQPAVVPTVTVSSPTRKRTRRSGRSGSATTASESAGTSPTSPNSAPPSGASSRRWRKPRDAKRFAAQANTVATMILNGEIDLDIARAYSGVARTMAQVLSAEVYRARFLQQEPNLSLDEEETGE